MKCSRSEPQSCEHIDTFICSQEVGSLLTPNGYIVYLKDANTYTTQESFFILKDKLFTYKGLSLDLPPKRTTSSPMERLSMSLGYVYNSDEIDIKVSDFPSILYELTMMALKDTKIISGNFSQLKQSRYGEHVFSSYLNSVNGKGKIRANNKHIRWLNEQDTLQLKSKLFTTTGYQAGVNAMEYTATHLMEQVIEKVYDFLTLIHFTQNTIVAEPLDFTVTILLLRHIKLRDTMLLLNNCIGFCDDGFIIRPTIMDTQDSRVYSVMTSIGSKTRELLGFINYDIGSALQTICLQLVDKPSIYPLHQELADDKLTFRTKVAGETGENIKWVKKELSKINNLDKMPAKYKQYPTLKSYYDEAQVLRQEILDNAEVEIASTAYSHAKFKWVAKYSKGEKQPEWIMDGKKSTSIFFFIWTQYEREIREAMMRCFLAPEACHQVHDAVYSKESIEVSVIQQHIVDESGFEVKISKE